MKNFRLAAFLFVAAASSRCASAPPPPPPAPACVPAPNVNGGERLTCESATNPENGDIATCCLYADQARQCYLVLCQEACMAPYELVKHECLGDDSLQDTL